MKQVIVPQPVSYAVLLGGVLVALLVGWRAYDTFTYITEAEQTAAAYHQGTE